VTLVRTISSPLAWRLGKESFWIVAGNGAAVLGSLVGVRILTGLMPPGEYGRLALGITVAAFANQVLSGPLSGGAARFYAVARELGELRHYLRSVYKLAFLGNGLILLLAAGITTVAALAGAESWVPLIVAALAFSIVSGYDSIASGIQNSARQRIVVALHAALGSWGDSCLPLSLSSGLVSQAQQQCGDTSWPRLLF